jgi:hypothetical protein
MGRLAAPKRECRWWGDLQRRGRRLDEHPGRSGALIVERTTRNRGVAVARQRDRAALFGLTDSAVPHGGLAPVVGAAHEVAGLLARNLVNSSYREEEEQKAIVEARSALTTGRFTLAERGRVSGCPIYRIQQAAGNRMDPRRSNVTEVRKRLDSALTLLSLSPALAQDSENLWIPRGLSYDRRRRTPAPDPRAP